MDYSVRCQFFITRPKDHVNIPHSVLQRYMSHLTIICIVHRYYIPFILERLSLSHVSVWCVTLQCKVLLINAASSLLSMSLERSTTERQADIVVKFGRSLPCAEWEKRDSITVIPSARERFILRESRLHLTALSTNLLVSGGVRLRYTRFRTLACSMEYNISHPCCIHNAHGCC
jgi:hypothetical protein